MERKNQVSEVMSFTSNGISRMFNRTTDLKKPTEKELARGRTRRYIEDILDQRKAMSEYTL